ETNKRTEVNRIVQSVAKCTHQGKWNIPIPHLIYFCNDYDVSQILLQDTPTSAERPITQITLNTPSENHAQYRQRQQRNQYSAAESTPGFFVSASVRADSDDNDDVDDDNDDTLETVASEQEDARNRNLEKTRKKRISKLKLEILKLKRKHAITMAHKKHLPNLSSLPLRKRRMLCKYRKSCYSSDQHPLETLYRTTLQQLATPREVCLAIQQNAHHYAAGQQHQAPAPSHSGEPLNDLALKVFCKYRKSCYEQVLGVSYDERVKKAAQKARKTHRVLTAKNTMMAYGTKVRKKRTLKEIAEIALKHADEREKRGAQRPKPKMAIVEKKLNELEEKRIKQLKCKYRKSCYETGIVSIVQQQPHYHGLVSDLYEFMIEYIPLPSMLATNETTAAENVTTSDKDEEYKKKLFCKYRKSCYATKVKPLIGAEEKFNYLHMVVKQEAEIPIQMKCHYRKSCYETGIVPTLRWSKPKEEDKTEVKMPWKEMPRSVAELKVRCHYRKSCYLQHAGEQTYLEHMEKAGEIPEPEQWIEVEKQIQQAKLPMNHAPTEDDTVKPKVQQEPKESEVKIEGGEEETVKPKTVSKRRKQKARKEPSTVDEEKQEPSSEVSDEETEEAIPTAAKPHRKYSIIASENKTPPVHGHHKYHPLRHHLEQIKLQRKHARMMAKRKHIIITQLTVPQQKLLCKYRKSCYETGVLPLQVAPKVEREPCDETETKELSEAEIKILCKYRKSCYDEIGAQYEQEQYEASAKKHRTLLSGRGKLHLVHVHKKRSVKEIAEIALERIDKRIEKVAQLSKPKMAIVEKKLSEADRDMRRRLECKYRRSCYETGEKPKIDFGDNWFMRMYRFIVRHVHTPGEESIANVSFAQLDDDHKKLYCKYRKTCYESGIKPFIDHEERFTYRYVIHKEEAAIPLEIMCHYRKSCYETGIVPDLRTAPHYLSEIEQPASPPVKKLVETILQLKVHCKYRKSCYVNITKEYPEIKHLLPTPPPPPPPKKRVVIPASKLASKKAAKAPQLEPEPTSTKPPKIVAEMAEQEELGGVPEEKQLEENVTSAEEKLPEVEDVAGEKQLEENITLADEKMPEEVAEKEMPATKKRAKPQKLKPTAPKPDERLEKKPKIAVDKKRKVAAEAEVPPESTPPPSKTIKKQKPIEKKEKTKPVNVTTTEKLKKAKPAKMETKKEKEVEKKPEGKEQKKEEPQKRVKTDEKPATPAPIKEIKKEEPKAKKVKPVESVTTQEPVVVQMVTDTQQVEEEIQNETKPVEAVQEKPFVKIPENVTKVRRPFEIRKKPQLSVPHREIRYIPPPPDESEIVEKKPTIKEVHIEGVLDTLEEKLRCKYRKSCYHNRTLPHPFEGFKIKHITKKEEQHQPLKYRCKFRKSCYESGVLPPIGDTFTVQHLVVVKDEHKPIALRCKYRKSCYETGEVPKIDQQYHIVTAIKNLLSEFYAETEEIRREMSEEERKLTCKYRKSCYATGKLPQIEVETIKTIADTMKESELSVHLRCKYRKSCYANYGIPVKDSKRTRKGAEAVIEQQPTPTSGKEQVKVRVTGDERAKLLEGAGTAEELAALDEEEQQQQRGKKSAKKGKKSAEKMKQPPVDEKEAKYMQIAVPPVVTTRAKPLSAAKKLKCKYRLPCYDGVPLHKLIYQPPQKPELAIKQFKRADGRPCTIYHLSCRRMAGLPIKERAPIGPNGRRLCRKKPKVEKATPI
ncbi:unnamed protein product, partial [Anisakis simplex]|uniref:VWFD domain-containing protein n=1 Tax=Anisakis simplex TaxID=6269 RepID=A0A0M3K7J5_ANISI